MKCCCYVAVSPVRCLESPGAGRSNAHNKKLPPGKATAQQEGLSALAAWQASQGAVCRDPRPGGGSDCCTGLHSDLNLGPRSETLSLSDLTI